MKLPLNKEYKEAFSSKAQEKRSHNGVVWACGSSHDEIELQSCKPCINTGKALEKGMNESIDKLWAEMGGTQIAYKEKQVELLGREPNDDGND